MSMHFFIEFVNKATDLRLYIPKRKVKMNVCSIWPFAQISDDFYILVFGNVPDILLQHYSRS